MTFLPISIKNPTQFSLFPSHFPKTTTEKSNGLRGHSPPGRISCSRQQLLQMLSHFTDKTPLASAIVLKISSLSTSTLQKLKVIRQKLGARAEGKTKSLWEATLAIGGRSWRIVAALMHCSSYNAFGHLCFVIKTNYTPIGLGCTLCSRLFGSRYPVGAYYCWGEATHGWFVWFNTPHIRVRRRVDSKQLCLYF